MFAHTDTSPDRLAYPVGWYRQGKQAARLMDRLLNGGRPVQLPVKATGHHLALNLSLAAKDRLNRREAELTQEDKFVW